MIGTLFRVEVEAAKRQAFIDFIEEQFPLGCGKNL
jgi:hypothetical protein